MPNANTHRYVARYVENHSSRAIDLVLDATDDTAAIAEVREIVRAGYRNEASAAVDLSNGRVYTAVNRHGNVRASIV